MSSRQKCPASNHMTLAEARESGILALWQPRRTSQNQVKGQKQLKGKPMHEGNLKKAIKNVKGVPDWLSEQLEQALYKHMINCSKVLHEIEDQQQ